MELLDDGQANRHSVFCSLFHRICIATFGWFILIGEVWGIEFGLFRTLDRTHWQLTSSTIWSLSPSWPSFRRIRHCHGFCLGWWDPSESPTCLFAFSRLGSCTCDFRREFKDSADQCPDLVWLRQKPDRSFRATLWLPLRSCWLLWLFPLYCLCSHRPCPLAGRPRRANSCPAHRKTLVSKVQRDQRS